MFHRYFGLALISTHKPYLLAPTCLLLLIQEALAETKRQKELEAELSQQQAEYDYKLAVLDAENRKLEIENKSV